MLDRVINESDILLSNLLLIAIRKHDIDTVKKILDTGAPCEQKEIKHCPLILALIVGDPAIVTLLLEKKPTLLNYVYRASPDSTGTVIHYAAELLACHGRKAYRYNLVSLIQAGAGLNILNEKAETPLCTVAHSNHPFALLTIQFLSSLGATAGLLSLHKNLINNKKIVPYIDRIHRDKRISQEIAKAEKKDIECYLRTNDNESKQITFLAGLFKEPKNESKQMTCLARLFTKPKTVEIHSYSLDKVSTEPLFDRNAIKLIFSFLGGNTPEVKPLKIADRELSTYLSSFS